MSADRQPVGDADVRLDGGPAGTRTTSKGEYAIPNIAPGLHVITVRRLGFAELSDTLTVSGTSTVRRDLVLTRIATLDSLNVTATAADIGMLEFEEHRRMGFGKFLDRAYLAANEGRRMSDLLATVSGVGIIQGRANRAWILSRRFSGGSSSTCSRRSDGSQQLGGSFYAPTQGEILQGMVCACYAQVYLDNTLMNPGLPSEPFDVNSIATQDIEAVEFYAGPSQTPSRYARLNSTCGVFVMRTRRSPR